MHVHYCVNAKKHLKSNLRRWKSKTIRVYDTMIFYLRIVGTTTSLLTVKLFDVINNVCSMIVLLSSVRFV